MFYLRAPFPPLPTTSLTIRTQSKHEVMDEWGSD